MGGKSTWHRDKLHDKGPGIAIRQSSIGKPGKGNIGLLQNDDLFGSNIQVRYSVSPLMLHRKKNHGRRHLAYHRRDAHTGAQVSMSLSGLTLLPPDPLLAIGKSFREDGRAKRMNLGIGVYCNERGETPVLSAVKKAEGLLLDRQSTKAYLGPEGDLVFIDLLLDRLIAPGRAMRGIQTVGGSGALSLAAELLARSDPSRRIWLGTPSWPNHLPIFAAAGLRVKTVDLRDGATGTFIPERLIEALQHAARGDVALVQGCCHNPSGIDLDADGWQRLIDVMAEKGIIPLVDIAYHGLGDGLEADLAGLRAVLRQLPEVLVAYSCNKNFGLYRERVGAVFVATPAVQQSDAAWSHLVTSARSRYSMPPDHGAAVVRTILSDEGLFAEWQRELAQMRRRICALRQDLAGRGVAGKVDFAVLEGGRGMFAMLPVSAAEVDRLAAGHAIYMAHSGRINIAGLAEERIGEFVAALAASQQAVAA
jgi:aromatic-amino-acid transaminase